MDLSKWQGIVWYDDYRYKVINCGRRAGKSTLASLALLYHASENEHSVCWYIAPTYRQAKLIMWQMLSDLIPQEVILSKNETELKIILKNYSEIVLKGADNPDSLRGVGIDFAIFDEVAFFDYWLKCWNVISPTLIDSKARVWFISTPNGFNHFKDLADNKYNLAPFKYYHYTSYDNPFIEKEEIDNLKKTMLPDAFSQEILADFRKQAGLIYKEFKEERDFRYFDHNLNEYGDYYFGLDFAVRGYTACLPIWIPQSGKIHVLDAYKVEGKTAEQHSEAIKVMLKKHADFDKWIGFADPAGFAKNQQKGELIWSIADEYYESGFNLTPANNKVEAGINYVRQQFEKENIVINEWARPLVEELRQYVWKEQKEGAKENNEDPESVRKLNDHLVDCLRYVLYSKPTAPEEPEVHHNPLMIKFPPPRIVPEEKEEFEELDIPTIYD